MSILTRFRISAKKYSNLLSATLGHNLRDHKKNSADISDFKGCCWKKERQSGRLEELKLFSLFCEVEINEPTKMGRKPRRINTQLAGKVPKYFEVSPKTHWVMPTKVVFVKKNQSDLDKHVEAAEAVEVAEAATVNEGPSR